jgi:hypothetical protein
VIDEHSGLAGATSHVSPVSIAPLLHIAEQSLSVLALQPVAQQPSLFVQLEMRWVLQATLQLAALPVSESIVQAFPSLQVVGQGTAGGSHVSPASTAPLPHFAEQSLSLLWLQPVGQQPSSLVQLVIR